MRILVVDDDAGSRTLLSRHLDSIGTVTTAADGSTALQAFLAAVDEGQPFDLIALDIQLPDLDGLSVLRLVRAVENSERLRPARVLMTTGANDLKSVARAYAASCDGYTTKPIRRQQLVDGLQGLGIDVSTKEKAAEPRRLRVLAIDDEATSRRILTESLSKFGDVEQCGDGEAALNTLLQALAEQRPFDLITLDIQLPNLDGHDVLQQLRAAEIIAGAKPAKVLMTTACSDPKNVAQAFHNLCDGYATKPIRPQALLDKLRELGVAPNA